MYLTVADVCLRFKICRATLYRLMDGTDFPAPIRVGRLLRWREQDLQQWEQNQISPPADTSAHSQEV